MTAYVSWCCYYVEQSINCMQSPLSNHTIPVLYAVTLKQMGSLPAAGM